MPSWKACLQAICVILSILQVFDVNMNTTVASLSGSFTAGHPKHTSLNGLSAIQAQVSRTSQTWAVL